MISKQHFCAFLTQQDFLRMIDEYGWHVMGVAPRVGEEGDLWSYSTGLYYRFKHPEIIVLKQTTDLQHNMINNIGERVKSGETFEEGRGYSDIIGNYDVRFRPVHPTHYWGWVNFACWLYDNDENK